MQFTCKTVLFQAIQFSTSSEFSSIWTIDRTLSGATTPGQSRTRSDGNDGVHHILQSSCITRTSPSDCLVSYTRTLIGGVLPLGKRCNHCILQPQPDGPEGLGKYMRIYIYIYIYSHMYVCVHIYMNACIYMYLYDTLKQNKLTFHIYIYIYIYIYSHRCVYKYICISRYIQFGTLKAFKKFLIYI